MHIKIPPLTHLKSKLANFLVPIYRKYKLRYRNNVDEIKGRKIYRVSPPKNDELQQKIIKDLKDEGISVIDIKDLFPDNFWWDKLRKEANGFIRNPEVIEFVRRFKNKESIEGFATDNYAKKYLYRKYNINRKTEISLKDLFLQFGIEEKMLDIVGGYFGRYGKLRMIDLWYNLAIGNKDPSQSQKWHRDGEDTTLIKVFLYFNDVDEDTGPFIYIPKSHLLGKFSELWPAETITNNRYGGVYPETQEFENSFSEREIRVCTGKAGTMIFCDTYGFHRGGYCKSKDRLLGNWVYTTPSSFCENTSPYSAAGNNLQLIAKQKFALSF